MSTHNKGPSLKEIKTILRKKQEKNYRRRKKVTALE